MIVWRGPCESVRQPGRQQKRRECDLCCRRVAALVVWGALAAAATAPPPGVPERPWVLPACGRVVAGGGRYLCRCPEKIGQRELNMAQRVLLARAVTMVCSMCAESEKS